MSISCLLPHPSLEANSVRELIDLAKKDPGKINYGSTGPGSTHETRDGIVATARAIQAHRSFPIAAAVKTLPDLLSGRMQLMLLGVPQSLPYLHDGQLQGARLWARCIAFNSLPDVPTIAEQGFSRFRGDELLVPLCPDWKRRKDVIARLQQETARAVSAADLRDRFLASGLTPIGSTPDVSRRPHRSRLCQMGRRPARHAPTYDQIVHSLRGVVFLSGPSGGYARGIRSFWVIIPRPSRWMRLRIFQ